MCNVLLVSDDATTAAKLINMLETMNFDVVVATTEFEVTRACASRQPRLLIADVETAAGVGFESIAAGRRLAREACIIAVSRYGHADLWPKVATACGADDYVAGPVTMVALATAIEACRNNALHRAVVLQ